MWFVFPQFDGLGSSSSSAQRFAIASREEAKDYWQHPVLGSRLRVCVELMLAIKGKSALEILDTPRSEVSILLDPFRCGVAR